MDHDARHTHTNTHTRGKMTGTHSDTHAHAYRGMGRGGERRGWTGKEISAPLPFVVPVFCGATGQIQVFI